jgi:RimJ/RimL family protein N-acetyltransferase
MAELSKRTPFRFPPRKELVGKFVRLEPFDLSKHGQQLYEAMTVEDINERMHFMFEEPPKDYDDFVVWFNKSNARSNRLYFAVIDLSSGKVGGWQALTDIDTDMGTAEIAVYWGPLISRRPAATEAQYLFATLLFDELGYRRYQWMCNNENEKSKRAAVRFGFKWEGILRQTYIQKGRNHDGAIYAILDGEWPSLKVAYEQWLSADNFHRDGTQRKRLEEFHKA